MVADRITEPFRHDTDHGDRCAAQFHRGAHDVVRPSNERCHTSYPSTTTPGAPGFSSASRSPRPIRGVTRAVRNAVAVSAAVRISTGACVADNQIPELRAVRPEAVDRPHIAPPFEEVPSDTEFRLVRQGIVRLDDDDAIAVGQRDRGPQQFAPQVVPARADPDRNGERQAPGNASDPDTSAASGHRACNPAACVLAVDRRVRQRVPAPQSRPRDARIRRRSYAEGFRGSGQFVTHLRRRSPLARGDAGDTGTHPSSPMGAPALPAVAVPRRISCNVRSDIRWCGAASEEAYRCRSCTSRGCGIPRSWPPSPLLPWQRRLTSARRTR